MKFPLNFRRRKKKEFPLIPFALAGAGTGLALGTREFMRRRRRMDFRDRVVVITGGSRGLGLELARLLANEGARLALLARNEPELEMARQEMIHRGADTIAITCDVGDRTQMENAIDQVVHHFGRIDALINNAGIIQVGPLDHLKIEDYENAMAVHFWGPLYAMMKVIPIMRQQGGGRIVNISSIGGRVAVPHLAAYDSSKFALIGLSDAFRAELARENIQVSTVAPGLMRTGSFYHGNFKGQNEKEFAWFSLMSTTPATAMHSSRAAKHVLEVLRYGIPKRTLTFQAQILGALEELMPNATAWIMKQANRMMPAPTGDRGNELRTGFESRAKPVNKWASKMGEKAAERNNELVAERMP